MEPEGTERGRSWPFVPFLSKNSCFGPSIILGLDSQITTNDNLSRMPRHSNMLVRSKCPPPSTAMSICIKQVFICGRSVGPLGPPEEGTEVQHMFFLVNCFFGLHGICSMSATNRYQLIWQVIFHSARSSALWRGVKTRPYCSLYK